ncbi:lethal(2) giant larvae protein homolog 1 isoform X1 [Cloeon dipterum]|uniref:lethal(2) giant larvae protein homolog 1 isoform X1 n=2 Tax=Cloeon dipterum TaxID=197152 RepID=UPI0032201161
MADSDKKVQTIQDISRVARMLKFIRGRGQQPTTERQRLQRELLNFKKTVQHGFPSKPTALAYDPILSLLAIGTASGAIKIFGKPGVEFYGQNEVSDGCGINKIIFLNGEGRLITILNDNSLVLWEIEETKCAKLVKVRALALEGKLKRISASRLESGNQHLLLGTEGGNVYLLNTRSFQMEENIIYQDVVIQNVPEDYKIRPGAVEALEEMPNNPKKLLIGYNRGLMVLWDREAQRTEQTYISTQELQSFSWHPSGSKFKSAHNDGSLVTWDASVGGRTPLEEPTTIYGPFPCKPITKIQWHDSKSEELVIFGGGMPRASHSDRYTVTAMKGTDEKHVVFDFTSHVVDFLTIMPEKNAAAGGQALVVLAEEEIVVIDLSDPEWRMIPLPYLVSLHASAVTCLQMVSPVPHALWSYLKKAGRQSEATYSNSAFPITGGHYANEQPEGEEEKESIHELLLTGHEDGSVRFWDADGVALAPLFKFSSEPYFTTGDDFDDDIADDAGDEEDWPPFRKVGCFDPYSDDPRLAVKKVALCPFTSTLIVAGTAGHILIVKLKNQDEPPKKIIGTVMNIVRDRDGFVWKGHDQLKLAESKGKMKKQAAQKGATVEALVQLHPPASITAITLHSTWGVLAAGTAHGLAVYDIVRHVSIQTKCTLNPNDLSGAGDTPISRRKSFKKSLRESFRRLRKGRSQRNANPNKAGSPAASPSKPETSQPGGAAGTSVALSRPVERQVEARPVEDALGSMVRCLALEDTFLVNQQGTSPTLWAGTNSGNVLIFAVTVPKGNKRKDEDVSCQLGKEIQLKHRAPVVNIIVLDGIGSPLPIPGEVNAGLVPAPDIVGPHRVVICSEEQFKTFTLPTLKPFCKSKLTATEGSMLRRAAAIRLTPSNVRAEEAQYALFGITNMGEILSLTLPDLRRLLAVPCIKREDINGISTLGFSRSGEAIFPVSSSELQRVSMATQKVTELKCHLTNMTRCKPEATTNGTTNGDAASESGASEAGSKKDEATGSASLNVSSGTEEQLEVSMGELTLDSVKDHLAPSSPGVTTSTPKSSPNANNSTAINSSTPNEKKEAAAALKNGGNSQSTEQKVLDTPPDVVDQENDAETATAAAAAPTPEPHSEINGSADGKAPLAISEDL